MKNIIKLLVLIFLVINLFATENFNCFTIIAGKDCTIDGSVLFGHNEDDGGDLIVNMYKVPRLSHSTEEFITLKNGGICSQVKMTHAYIWLDMPGMQFSDSYFNEHNVVIASNNCPSREDKPELTDGGIGYWLRRIMAERAKSAKEAVKIGGKLVEKYGYNSAGRSYCIADPNEAWIMSIINGKHWVAQRVPDDKVILIPNYYMIQQIDLNDTLNFMGSSNLIDYALARGWYNPELDGEFNFREVYGSKKMLESSKNINRQWAGLRLIANQRYDIDDSFPFAAIPQKKLDITDIFAVLRDHYEGTDLETINKAGNPHNSENRPICHESTQYGFVAQLDSRLPREIAGVMWYAPVQPCLHPFVPVFINTMNFSPFFAYGNYETGLKFHFDENYSEIKQEFTNHRFRNITNFSLWVNKDYFNRSNTVIKARIHDQKKIITAHKRFQNKLNKKFSKNPQKTLAAMTHYSNENLLSLDYKFPLQK